MNKETKELINAQEKMPAHRQSLIGGQGFSRREFFKLSALGLTGFFFSQVAKPMEVLAQTGPQLENTARYCIFVHLDGAPSHVDTFDLKEGDWTPKEFEPTTIGQFRWPKGLLPKLAEQLDKVSIVRSMSAYALVHPLAQIWTQIGRNPASGLSKIAPNIGAVVALEYESRRTANQKLPGFIALNAGNIVGRGYFPPQAAPFGVAPNPSGLANSTNPVGESRFTNRYNMLQSLDEENRKDNVIGAGSDDMAAAYTQARDLMYNPEVQSVFQYSESDSMSYGNSGFGNACLVARNIVKSDLGTRFIQINLGGWDNHNNIYTPQGLFNPARALDAGLGQLIADLAKTPSQTAGKSLLDETLIVAMGEFGRTVGRLNNQQGRDHYLQMSCLFAGAGVRGGRPIGSTDAMGAATLDPGWARGVTIRPEDVFCTIYSALGIDYTLVRQDDPFKRGFEYVPYANQGVYAPIDVLWT
ncbi:MAG: DUF1501 domain-containing protein [Blastocatellia bacterium]